MKEDEEEDPEELLDDDNNKQKPQFIPRRGLFYEHDNRNEEPGDNERTKNQEKTLSKVEREKKKTKGKEFKWEHDKFIELEQLLSTLDGANSNMATPEMTSESLKGEKSFENIDSVTERGTSLNEKIRPGGLMRDRPGARRRENKGPQFKGTWVGGHSGWDGQQHQQNRGRENKGPHFEGTRGGWGSRWDWEQQNRRSEKSDGWKGRKQGQGVGKQKALNGGGGWGEAVVVVVV